MKLLAAILGAALIASCCQPRVVVIHVHPVAEKPTAKKPAKRGYRLPKYDTI